MKLNIHSAGRVPTLKELGSSSRSELPAGEDHRNTNNVTPGGSQNLEAAPRLLTSKKSPSIHCTDRLGKGTPRRLTKASLRKQAI